MPNVYIAAPFFNEVQLEVVEHIENVLKEQGLTYYSPRTDSGSHLLTPEEKKNYKSWKPVFDKNLRALRDTDMVLAVLDYPLPEKRSLRIVDYSGTVEDGYPEIASGPVSIPDTGTVFEMGYANCEGIPTLGYLSQGYPDLGHSRLNLMLSHTCFGFIVGPTDFDAWANQDTLIVGPGFPSSREAVRRLLGEDSSAILRHKLWIRTWCVVKHPEDLNLKVI